MRYLKSILFSVYVILILLLLLFNLKSCGNFSRNNKQETDIVRSDSTDVVPKRDSTEIIRKANKIGNIGALKVTLLWDFQGDIDLHVKQPNGNEIYYKKPSDNTTGGFLDVDNKNGGSGSAENIFWSKPQKGTYIISLVYFQPSMASKIAEFGNCTVVVFKEGEEPRSYEVSMTKVKENKIVANINVQ